MQPSSQDLEFAARAVSTLRALGRNSWSAAEFVAIGRSLTGGSIEELLDFLRSCGLVKDEFGSWGLSDVGEQAFDALAAGDWAVYAHSLLTASAFEDELMRLIEGATEEPNSLRCPLAALPRLAPRAGVLLTWDPGLRQGDDLVLPLSLLDSLLVTEAMGRSAEIPPWVLDRNAVGWRAELYTLRLERSRLGPHRVRHVSREVGDGFGYDIETDAPDSRLIEVKGSRSASLRFHLSNRELEVARADPERHFLHFWGKIDLDRDPADEYSRLRELQYPVVISKLASAIDAGELEMQARSWLLTAPAVQDSGGGIGDQE